MKCTEAKPLLDLLCDGALEAKDSALLLDHLKTCHDCSHEWHALEDLRARFQKEKASTQIPAGLTDRISEGLKKEESQGQKIFAPYLRQLPFVAIAAGLLILGFFVGPTVYQTGMHTSSEKVVSESLIDDLGHDASAEVFSDRDELAKRVGYDIKYVRLPDWHMQKSALYKSASSSRVARFDFIRETQSGAQYLTCYQAPQGLISASDAKAANIGGKQVRLGHRGRFQFALWSQNGRDYLFITTMPTEQLEEIVRGA